VNTKHLLRMYPPSSTVFCHSSGKLAAFFFFGLQCELAFVMMLAYLQFLELATACVKYLL
jgi:hypothetical protein